MLLCAVMIGTNLSGCFALQAVNTVAVSAIAYKTVTKKEPPLYTSECAWAEEFKPSEGFEERWKRGEKIQAVIHNRRYRCHCLKEQASCQ